jgi:hypothetical protein
VHTFPLQIGVHEVKSWSAFSLTQNSVDAEETHFWKLTMVKMMLQKAADVA